MPERTGPESDKPLAPGLYLVATPIGNLEDITLRALRVLRQAQLIACEDTRQTQKLLNHFDIPTHTISYHLHNERGRAEELVERMRRGERIAVVSDAGTPGIADPGEAIAAAAIEAGIPVYAVPGANAMVSGLICSGLPSETFTFGGFLPAKPGERRSTLEALHQQLRSAASAGVPIPTQVFYETPHRIADALSDIEAVFGPEHRIALARELTKLHEEFLRGTVSEVRTTLAARESIRGEMVLVLSGQVVASQTATVSLAEAVRMAMQKDGVDEKEALKRVARERGIGKSEAYREWQRVRGARR